MSVITLKKRQNSVLDCEIDLRAFITRFNRIEWSDAEKSGEQRAERERERSSIL